MGHPFEVKLAESWPVSQWGDMTVLVAVSGGPDSVALLRGLLALRSEGAGQLVVGHFNHRWRDEAEDDATFVQQLAGQLQLTCLSGVAAESLQRNEETARRQRYGFLVDSARQAGARYVALAHTADDQIETILHRIMRGTGISGLAGMPRVRQLDHGVALMRPLLHCQRTSVVDYLKEIGQSCRIDATNQDLQYTRNRIRHELLPQLNTQYHEGVRDALLRLGERAAEVQQLLDLLAEDLIDRNVILTEDSQQQQVQIDCNALTSCQHVLLQEMFVAVWKRLGWPRQAMGSEQWQRLAEMVASDPGKDACTVQALPGQVEAKKEGESLWLTRPRENHP